MATYVNTNDLRDIAKEIASRQQAISDLYQNNIKSILKMSEGVMKFSGLDFEEICGLYDAIFYNLDAKLYNIHHMLEGKIATNYESLDASVSKAFNEDFAQQMKDIMY